VRHRQQRSPPAAAAADDAAGPQYSPCFSEHPYGLRDNKVAKLSDDAPEGLADLATDVATAVYGQLGGQ
jgi:hypothetical protein